MSLCIVAVVVKLPLRKKKRRTRPDDDGGDEHTLSGRTWPRSRIVAGKASPSARSSRPCRASRLEICSQCLLGPEPEASPSVCTKPQREGWWELVWGSEKAPRTPERSGWGGRVVEARVTERGWPCPDTSNRGLREGVFPACWRRRQDPGALCTPEGAPYPSHGCSSWG